MTLEAKLEIVRMWLGKRLSAVQAVFIVLHCRTCQSSLVLDILPAPETGERGGV